MFARHSWLRSLLAASILCVAFGAHSQEVPMDQTAFTAYVADKMRQELGSVPVAVKSPLTLLVGELQGNLDRIFSFCKSNEQRCASEVERYVKGVAQVAKERNAPLDKSAVRLVIRSSEYVKRAQASLGSDGPSLQAKRFVEGLDVVPVLDTPRAVRPLDNRDLKALNLSQDELLDLGRSNVETNLKPLSEVAKPASSGQIGRVSGSVYDTSRVLLLPQWTKLAEAQGGTLLVSLPATDVLLYVSESTPAAIEAIRTFGHNVMSRAPNPLSATLLRWTPTGWEVVP